MLLPDVLTVKLGDPSGFLNGRRLGDDVIDAEFSLLTKGAIPSDGVDANDKSFVLGHPSRTSLDRSERSGRASATRRPPGPSSSIGSHPSPQQPGHERS